MAQFDEFGARERDGWADGGIVSAYVTHFGPITDRAGAAILGDTVRPGDRVLDLCCGQGSLTAAIAERGAEATGLDFSPEMVARARRAAPAAKIVEGDATVLPFGDAGFDAVICNFGMMHIADQPKALSEIRRVLKPGGRFALATWAMPSASPAFGIVLGALKAHADFSAVPAQPDLFALADHDRAAEMISAAGLEFEHQDTLEAEWVLAQPNELFDIFLTGTVGVGMLIRSQTAETVERIADTIVAQVRDRHFDGNRYRVPVAVATLSARAA